MMSQQTARDPSSSSQGPESQTSARPVPEWSSLTFSLTETDFMYRSLGDQRRQPVWDQGTFLPYGNIEISPAAAFLSYGVGVFEGLKAQQSDDGRLLLFRPDANGRRLQRSAERLSMAPFPVEQFVEACVEMVRRNRRFVPPNQYGSLYIRPMQHAVQPRLGLGPCDEFAVHMFASPVGTYFSEGSTKQVKLRVLDQGRCAPGGTGSSKAMGNYAGAIWVAADWKAKGYDDVLYLDSRHVKYITETSGSNPFVKLRSGKLVTPPVDTQVLPGITRDSAIRVARERFGVEVEERQLSIDEVFEEGVELFCTGTAWTLLSVGQIDHGDAVKTFPEHELRDRIFAEIYGIQTGAVEDPFAWIVEV